MKTAKQIIEQVVGLHINADVLTPMDSDECIACITEDREQIKRLIDKMIKKCKREADKIIAHVYAEGACQGEIDALTKLKSKIGV